ncbi:MAG: very short patch repair endonuclease [Dehalococcoidia bacterium]
MGTTTLPPFERPAHARSRNMAAIRSVDTRPELTVRRAVHRAGLRYRLHNRRLPGCPDMVFPRFHLAAFVHGCFWHGHTCKIGHVPGSNTAYWSAKIGRNVSRDARNQEVLVQNGWKVRLIRECDLTMGTTKLIEELMALRSVSASN